MNELNIISGKIIGAAIKVHQKLGPGLLESIYQEALIYELIQLKLKVKSEVSQEVIYEKVKIPKAFRIDLLVENSVIVEIKAVEKLLPVHFSQTLSYLKLSGLKLALLINFKEALLKNGIKRIVNNF